MDIVPKIHRYYCCLIILFCMITESSQGPNGLTAWSDPGQLAMKMIDAEMATAPQNARQNQWMVDRILDKLTTLFPMHDFVVLLADGETSLETLWYNNNNMETYTYNGRELGVLFSLGAGTYLGNTRCFGDISAMFASCHPVPENITVYMEEECGTAYLGLYGTVDASLNLGLARSVPDTAFRHELISCPGNLSQQWHVILTLHQQYFVSLKSLPIGSGTPDFSSISLVAMVTSALMLTLLFVICGTTLFVAKNNGCKNRVAMRFRGYFLMPEFTITDKNELDPTAVDIEQLIYTGPNSRVYFGRFAEDAYAARASACLPRFRNVVVKVPSADAYQIGAIRGETRINAQLKHARIVVYVGFYRDAFGAIRIVSEFMPGGDLHTHLADRKKLITVGHLYNFLGQIAEGMEYLASKKIIHRDLAARNCMLNRECTELKIADFGLSRHFSADATYSCTNPVRLPIRWVAVECFGESGEVLRNCKFSEKTDIWAFGVLIWECFTRGAQPYGDEEFADVLVRIRRQGWRMPCPPGCPVTLYSKVIKKCWADHPDHRPTFATVRKMLDNNFGDLMMYSPDMTIQRIL